MLLSLWCHGVSAEDERDVPTRQTRSCIHVKNPDMYRVKGHGVDSEIRLPELKRCISSALCIASSFSLYVYFPLFFNPRTAVR